MKDKPFRTVGIFDKGYDIEEVDDFLRRAKDNHAYDESVVDVYLERAASVLLSVE